MLVRSEGVLWEEAGRLGPLDASAAEWGGRAATGEAQASGVLAQLDRDGGPVLPGESGSQVTEASLASGNEGGPVARSPRPGVRQASVTRCAYSL